MAHDRDGHELKVGDKVLIPATVQSMQLGDTYCNVSLSTDEPMYPGDYKTNISLNGKQVCKVFEVTTTQIKE